MEDTTNITKVFCLGDGYAHGHIWPEWPQILQALRPDLDIAVISAVGAGHEFLVSELLTKNIEHSLIIFQWPMHQRFDKLLQDQIWENVVETDNTYNFNTYSTDLGKWWCSSASKLKEIRQYHEFYVQDRQSLLRQKNMQILLSAWIKQQNARHFFTSNQAQETFAKTTNCRGKEIQPEPLCHYYWLVESVIPATGLDLDKTIANKLLYRIKNHKWVPYDPDRKEIWYTMSHPDL